MTTAMVTLIVSTVSGIVGFAFSAFKHALTTKGEKALPAFLRPAYKLFGDAEVQAALAKGSAAYEDYLKGGSNLQAEAEAYARTTATAYLKKVAKDKGFYVPDSFINAIVEMAIAGLKSAEKKIIALV